MPRSPVFWSAQACPFRRAGVYFGLSDASTHVRVAHRLLPRRGTPHAPGTTVLRPGQTVPLVYIAVRDPSAVRVVPVRNGGANNGAEHVSLVFPANPRATPQTNLPSVQELQTIADTQEQAAFVVTVGLRTEHEPEFYRRLVQENPDLMYAQLCDVITALKDEFAD